MSLSLTTSDWMMVTRLIYRINCIDAIEDYPGEVLRLLKPMVPFSRGIFNLLQKKEDTTAASRLCGFHFPEKELEEITEQELNSNFFLQSLYFDFSAKVSRGPSLTELNHKNIAGIGFFPDSVQHALTMILQYKEDVDVYKRQIATSSIPPFSMLFCRARITPMTESSDCSSHAFWMAFSSSLFSFKSYAILVFSF